MLLNNMCTCVINDFNREEIARAFFGISGNKLYVKWKGYNN